MIESESPQVLGEGVLKSVSLGLGMSVIVEFEATGNASVSTCAGIAGKQCRVIIEVLDSD